MQRKARAAAREAERGGRKERHATPSASAAAPVSAAPSHMAASAASPAGSKVDWSPKSTSVDWWQTPNKYRRRELDDKEIEAINVRKKDFQE